jgi:hypothetical protein
VEYTLLGTMVLKAFNAILKAQRCWGPVLSLLRHPGRTWVKRGHSLVCHYLSIVCTTVLKSLPFLPRYVSREYLPPSLGSR